MIARLTLVPFVETKNSNFSQLKSNIYVRQVIKIENIPVFFFLENQASNKCATFTLIGNLMRLPTGNLKSHFKNKY